MNNMTTGITSSRPSHITIIKTHFETTGISAETYPVVIPHVENADVISKRMLVIGYVDWSNCRMTMVATNMTTTERMITSIVFAVSSSAVARGMTRPSLLKGISTLPLTKSAEPPDERTEPQHYPVQLDASR